MIIGILLLGILIGALVNSSLEESKRFNEQKDKMYKKLEDELYNK